MKHFIQGKRIGCDTETNGLNPWGGDRPFAFSFANTKSERAYFEFPVCHKTRRVDYRAKPRQFAQLKTFYADPTIEKVFHNAKFDLRNLEAAGIEVLGPVWDTEIKLRICDGTRLSYELKPVCEDLFGISKKDQKDLSTAVNGLRTRAKRMGWAIVTGDNAADYWILQYAQTILVKSLKLLKTYQNAGDAVKHRMRRDARQKARGMVKLCRRYAVKDAERAIILDTFLESVLDEYDIRHIYEEEMREVFPVLYAMEGRGVYLDRKKVVEGRERAQKQYDKHSKTIVKLCDEARSDLNPNTFPNSYPQKVAYFIDELELEPLHYGKKTGNAKLDKTFLEFYEDDVPMCGAIQGQGKASKAIGTYYDNYLSSMDEDGIIHGSFQQCGAKTGRVSCRGLQLQTVPKRGKCRRCKADLKIAGWKGDKVICKACGRAVALDVMLEVRRPFGPRPGCVWYCYDFEQIEARIFADEADEEFMLRSFRRGRDVYQDFADVIEKETGLNVGRQDTKSIFLGKLYGLGVKKLIKQIMDSMHGEKIDEDIARGVIDVFDEQFPRVSEFMQETIVYAKENQCVYNRYGQRIDILPPRYDPVLGRMVDDSYKGVNYIIQSSAARLMKRAMIKCAEYLRRIGFGWLVMTIHDELIFEFEKTNRPRKVLRTLGELIADNDGMFTKVKTSVDVKKVLTSWLEPIECDFVSA